MLRQTAAAAHRDASNATRTNVAEGTGRGRPVRASLVVSLCVLAVKKRTAHK
jgi:hypothetical protein